MWQNLHWQATISALVFGLGAMVNSTSSDAATPAEDDAAYTRTITERADKIVAPLAIEDPAKATRVRDLIVNQYRSLSAIHAARDAKIAEAPKGPGDSAVAEAWRGLARKEADLKIFPVHRQFVAHLEAELTPEQVNQVKDGITYGVLPLTFNRYRELLPDLTVEQQADILANLLEAREYAMDAGTSEEKHAWFGKYKGRINNVLSAAGYNMKQAEQDLAERENAAATQ
jgi:Protein of unknown function (DUF3826)